MQNTRDVKKQAEHYVDEQLQACPGFHENGNRGKQNGENDENQFVIHRKFLCFMD